MSYLRWLWRDQPGVATVLAVAMGIALICVPGFTVSEIAALSTVRLVHDGQPAVIHLGAGAYNVSQDIGDADFPDDATDLTVTGPSGRIPVTTFQPPLSLADAASTLLGVNDCYVVMSFTIRQAGSYKIAITDREGMSGAWISEPWVTVVARVLPWALGLIAAPFAIAVCLLGAGTSRRPRRRLEREPIAGTSW